MDSHICLTCLKQKKKNGRKNDIASINLNNISEKQEFLKKKNLFSKLLVFFHEMENVINASFSEFLMSFS